MRGRAWMSALFLLGAGAAQAAEQGQPRPGFWPGPLPERSSWGITEMGIVARLTDRHAGDELWMVTASLGWMRNAGPGAAWGGELFMGAEGDFRGGLAVRGRWWLTPHTALDGAVGVHLFGDATSQDVKRGSPMVTARLAYRDRIAAVARYDVLGLSCGPTCVGRTDVPNPNATSRRLYFGTELGGKAGVVAMSITAILLGAFVLSYGAST
jgi:hypothetical protein